MATHTVGEFKPKISDVLADVRRGAVAGVRDGRGQKLVAILISSDKAPTQVPRKLGPLVGKASFRLKRGFKISDAELLGS